MNNKTLVAICVGHSRKINGATEGGATSLDKAHNEHTYNLSVALEMSDRLNRFYGIGNFIVDFYRGKTYMSAMADLGDSLKAAGATLAVELHFNSFDGFASGFEALYWSKSAAGERFAKIWVAAMASAFPDRYNRGVKPIASANDRGGRFLTETHCPAVILEPFFGSNEGDWAVFKNADNQTKLGAVYTEAVAEFLNVSAQVVPDIPALEPPDGRPWRLCWVLNEAGTVTVKL